MMMNGLLAPSPCWEWPSGLRSSVGFASRCARKVSVLPDRLLRHVRERRFRVWGRVGGDVAQGELQTGEVVLQDGRISVALVIVGEIAAADATLPQALHSADR